MEFKHEVCIIVETAFGYEHLYAILI